MTKQRQTLFLISTALVIATLIAYEPVRKNGFVNYDDGMYITKNPDVTGGITGQSIIWAFTKFYSCNWHPLTWISHMLDCEIYGLNPIGHHITNVLFHIINSLLLLWLLWQTTGAIWPSAFVAAAFALHPVHVESVAWAAERKDVLSTMFWMLTILAYVRYVKRPNYGRYATVLVAFAMGLMSKPMVVTLPFVLLLLDYWPLERLGGQRTEDGRRRTEDGGRKAKDTSQKVSTGRLIAEKVPLFVLSAISSVVTVFAQHSGGAIVTLDRIPFNYRIANTFISYIKYTGKTFWPGKLVVLYSYYRKEFPTVAMTLCIFIFILLTILFIYIGRRKKYVLVGWLWFVGTLVPVIGLLQVGSQMIADRYMYVPMVGLLIIIGWGIKDVINNNPRRQTAALISAVILLCSAIVFTRMQVQVWQNSLTLFGHAVEVTKDNNIAETNYGCALYAEERADEAIAHLRNAVRINPAFPQSRNTLGKILMEEGKLNEAVTCFYEIIRRQKDFKEGYTNLASALSKQGKYNEAMKYYNQLLELDPEYPNIQSKIGTLLLMAGKTNEALAIFNKALQTDDDQMDIYVNLSIAYNRLDNYELSIQNRDKAAALKSENPDTLNNLAWLLATVDNAPAEDINKAIGFAQHACEIKKYKEPSFMDTLAAAYAAAGRFEDAVKTAEEAIRIAKSKGKESLVNEIKVRLELYKAGQPYREKQVK